MCGIAPLRMQPGGTRVTNPWLPLGPLPVTASKQQPQQHTKPAEWPHKFQPGSDWAIVTGSDASPGEALPYCTLAEYDNLDKELVKEEVKDLFRELPRWELPKQWRWTQRTAKAQDQPMETKQPELSPGKFRPEWIELGYTPFLISSPDLPRSPITPTENALLDTLALETQGQDQSKDLAASRLEGSPSKSGMTLWKRKT